MHPTPASTEKPLRAASTLILLRDSDTGPQVLMLKRHGLSEVLAGAFVFPGGKLDAPDAELMDSPHLDEAAPVLHARLGEHDIGTALAVGLYVAALRETFEESGLLLAEDLAETRAQEALARLASGMAFNTLLAEMGLRLRVGALAPWSRWVTPPDSPNKRFDTRFFEVSGDAVARHDDRETTESEWLAPRAALERYWAREISLAPPQIMSLAQLARHADVDSVLREAGSRPPPVIQPEPLKMDGLRVVAYPGDPAHPVSARAMPGPSRLVFREDRFEPVDGFGALFA